MHLCEKGTLRELVRLHGLYRIRYNQAHGILEAHSHLTAVPLTNGSSAQRCAKLESLTGKTIDLKTKVDAKVLERYPAGYRGHRSWTAPSRTACTSLRRDIAAVTLLSFFPCPLCKRGQAQNNFHPKPEDYYELSR